MNDIHYEKLASFVGPVLRAMRISKSLTGVYVAKNSGISTSFLSEIETAKRRPSYDTFTKLCEALEVEKEFALARAAEMKDSPQGGNSDQLFSGVSNHPSDASSSAYKETLSWLLNEHLGEEASYAIVTSLIAKASARVPLAGRRARVILEALDNHPKTNKKP